MSRPRGISNRRTAAIAALRVFANAKRLMLYAASKPGAVFPDEAVVLAHLQDEAARAVRLLDRSDAEAAAANSTSAEWGINDATE